MRTVLLLFFFLPLVLSAQKKKITLEDLYKKGTFRGEMVQGFAREDFSNLFEAEGVSQR